MGECGNDEGGEGEGEGAKEDGVGVENAGNDGDSEGDYSGDSEGAVGAESITSSHNESWDCFFHDYSPFQLLQVVHSGPADYLYISIFDKKVNSIKNLDMLLYFL